MQIVGGDFPVQPLRLAAQAEFEVVRLDRLEVEGRLRRGLGARGRRVDTGAEQLSFRRRAEGMAGTDETVEVFAECPGGAELRAPVAIARRGIGGVAVLPAADRECRRSLLVFILI